MEEVTTPETLPDGVDVAPTVGGGADQPRDISLDALKTALGKEFKDPDTALKSIKDTYNFVGDVGKVKSFMSEAKLALNTDDAGVLEALSNLKTMDSQPENTVEQKKDATPKPKEGENFITREQYELDTFFAKNSNLEDVRDILTPLKNASEETKSMPWSQFVEHDSAKKVISSFARATEADASKSVLESNPRLGQATDKLSEANKLVTEASQAGYQGDIITQNKALNQARENAVAGVMEAYDLK